VPTYEYYGFAVYLGSTALFILYITWALLGPERLERWIGDLGYPSPWWATAIPAWCVVLLLYIYVALACYNIQVLTPKLNDTRCMTDSHA
ncbi:PIG-P protein, partial [Protomyces lactucae-debilis]